MNTLGLFRNPETSWRRHHVSLKELHGCPSPVSPNTSQFKFHERKDIFLGVRTEGLMRALFSCVFLSCGITRATLKGSILHQRAEICWAKILPSCGLGLWGGEGDVCTTMAISTVSLTRKDMPTCICKYHSHTFNHPLQDQTLR